MVDVVGTVLAVGHYEHRITVVTHGQPDLPAAAMMYDLFVEVLGFPDELGAVRWTLWPAVAVLTVAAVSMWRRRTDASLRPVAAWIAAAVLLKTQAMVYDAVAAPPGPAFVASRPVAYPLWTAATVVLLVAAALTARTIRRAGAPAIRQ